MTSGIEALFSKAKKSLAAAKVLVKDGYYDFAAPRSPPVGGLAGGSLLERRRGY
jgi:hypothetical protein